MSKIKTMGASPLTGNIYYGTVDMDKSCCVGKKTDVTDMACEAVAEHLFHTQKSKVYRLKDGRELVISVQVREVKDGQ
ncbi:DUF7446 family protein [Serratia marcescens]|uniref:DUF7446 family protein n=1 Tax=Serratia marcescens TaxID=615 RepID=UPI001153B9C1|nr:hypothetical protein [Serratia marcescens]QDI41665.1 hypothetical protein FG172_05445 [Serratia marcescens]QDI56096.1 hypothetical protein FG175_05445 [Serratia marcescens]